VNIMRIYRGNASVFDGSPLSLPIHSGTELEGSGSWTDDSGVISEGFFRIEVETSLGRRAYTNPIWISNPVPATIYVPDDYAKIQWAVDNATEGDTIIVKSGTYYENVWVNKRLILRGLDTDTGKPVVDARGSVTGLTLAAKGITVEGFFVRNSGAGYPGIKILSSSNSNTLTNNTLSSNNDCGIMLEGSSNNNLSGNTISNNPHGTAGISLFSSSNNTFSHNSVKNNSGSGIFLWYSSNNTFSHNTVTKNFANGISLVSSSANTLSYNTVINNGGLGILLQSSSTKNNLNDNTVSNNTGTGIYFWSSSNNNTLSGNTIRNNWCDGIELWCSSNNTFSGNTISNNGESSIYLWSSNDNIIYNNYFNNTNNAYDDGNNIWNIIQTAGPNIIGGSWLGGNYWSDYVGEDLDGDGVGDTSLPYNSSGNISNGGDYLPLVKPAPPIFDTGKGTYPSISCNHTGTITPNQTLRISKLYTYPCPGTGGHTEYAAISYSNGTEIAEAHWNGYVGDWQNITFNRTFVLCENETYNYTIRTGSYPQIHHTDELEVASGTITCKEFVDANGKRYNNWIPAIKLFL
jgi:nitrous oxidase accessory protein